MLARIVIVACCLAPGVVHAEVLDCMIQPKNMIDLVATEEGRIELVAVSRGDRIKRGDLVVQLDDTVQRLQVQMAEVRKNSDVEVKAGAARLVKRQKELDRATQLQERAAGTVIAVEEAEIELALTKLAAQEAGITQELAAIQHLQAEELLARRRITSPVDGVVAAVHAAPGEYAHDQLKIMTIAEIDPLHVEVFVPPEYHNRIAIGDVYEVSQIAPLQGRYPALVTVVDLVFDAASGTFGVQLEIDNPSGDILAGTRCRIDFTLPLTPAG
jgi:RND family efflux transporter MFP subunit